MSMEQRAMLNRHELLERIRQINEEGSTGCLSLSHSGKVITVHFREGLISAVSTNLPNYQLGQYIQEYFHSYLIRPELLISGNVVAGMLLGLIGSYRGISKYLD